MQAVTIPAFGGADVLQLSELETLEAARGQVAIDVAFAGANYAEILFRQGAVDVPLPYDVRDRIPLEDAQRAHREIESGSSVGKLVLAVR